MRGGRGGPPGGMGGPGRGGPMGKPGGNMEGDRWGKRALPPPPPGSGGGAIAGLPALHKTDNKFKVRLGHAVHSFLTIYQKRAWNNNPTWRCQEMLTSCWWRFWKHDFAFCIVRVCQSVTNYTGLCCNNVLLTLLPLPEVL